MGDGRSVAVGTVRTRSGRSNNRSRGEEGGGGGNSDAVVGGSKHFRCELLIRGGCVGGGVLAVVVADVQELVLEPEL